MAEIRMSTDERLETLDQLAYRMAPVGIVLTENRFIRTCNPAFAAMFGFAV